MCLKQGGYITCGLSFTVEGSLMEVVSVATGKDGDGGVGSVAMNGGGGVGVDGNDVVVSSSSVA